jgi:malate dehydrogenase (oxaloacetate-decarboxylating)
MQRVLGLGDQGIGGMGIPIGKLSLYTALGGIDPARTLSVLLDVGTDNAELLDDPVYLAWRHRRIGGADYDDFVDRFVQAVRAELPNVLLQWEDFATPHALPILERYREQVLSFNDDIQGTAAVVLAALSAGAAATGSRLRDQTVVMLGAGSARIGVCEQVVRSMVADGLDERNARTRIFLVDINGLLTTDRPDLDHAQRRLAQHAAVQPDQPQRGPATGSGRLDRRPCSRRQRIAVPADAGRRCQHSGRPMQQHLHLPRRRPGRDRRARDPRHRRHDDRGCRRRR